MLGIKRWVARWMKACKGCRRWAQGAVCWLAGGHKWRTQKEALDEGVDLVVATPGRLAEHIKAGTLKLARCQAVVLDEADVLLGDAFAFAQQARPCPGRSVATSILSSTRMQGSCKHWLQTGLRKSTRQAY